MVAQEKRQERAPARQPVVCAINATEVQCENKLVDKLGNRDEDDENGAKLEGEHRIGGGEGRGRVEAAALPLVVLGVASEVLVRPQRIARLPRRAQASERVARRPVRLSPIHLEVLRAARAARHQVRGLGKYEHDRDEHAEEEVREDYQAEAREGNCDRNAKCVRWW